MWQGLADHVVLAQTAPGFDTSTLLTSGPAGVLAVFMFYLWRRSEDRLDKEREAHKIEIAAERALNTKKQDQQLEDQKTIIPLAKDLITAADDFREMMKK